MESRPGTYALVLKSTSSLQVEIGRWGTLQVKPGYYIYIGSAFGPGGVLSRVSRHCRENKPKRWHIDYLREHSTPVACWYSYDPKHLEHLWANCFAGVDSLFAIDGFGCSDCQCRSHLFLSENVPACGDVLKLRNSQSHSIMCETFD
jgi:Uri superfamily endonuclease